MFELMRSAPSGDYFAHVQTHRLSLTLNSDPRVMAVFHEELKERISAAGHNPESDSIEKELARKDGKRRFSKLVEAKASVQKEQPSLLTGTGWETCLAEYKRLIYHVESLWADACQLFHLTKFPLAAFLAILTVEEIGKLSGVWLDLVMYDAPRQEARKTLIDRDHRRKHLDTSKNPR